MSFKASAALCFLALASRVAAHGVLTSVTVGGKKFAGVEPSSPADTVSVEWHAFGDTDHGFVDPTHYSSPDIICHKQAKPGQTHATAAAGSVVEIQWDTWPESHKGPVIDYIANCNGPCEAIKDPTTLKWIKIDEAGFLQADGSQTGRWASDKLIAQGFKWPVTIPKNLKAGNYVLRHEIIALHSANAKDQAQNYPLCVNLEITGGGDAQPAGVPGTSLYKNTDPGIFFNIYTTPTKNTYPIPGPPLPSDFGGSSSGAGSVAATTKSATPTSSPISPSTFTTSSLPSSPTAQPASQPASCLDTSGLTPEMQRVLDELVAAMRAAGKGTGTGKRGVQARGRTVRRGWGLVEELGR